MAFLKVLILYCIGSVVTITITNYIAPQISWMTSPFQTTADIVLGVAWFTICFSLFDWFVLRKILEKQKKRK